MFCKKCGSEMPDNSEFCAKCGAKADKSEQYFVNVSAAKTPIDDTVSAGLVILSILIPLVGIIMGFVFHSEGRKHAGKTYIIVAIVSAVLLTCIFSSIIRPLTLSYINR